MFDTPQNHPSKNDIRVVLSALWSSVSELTDGKPLAMSDQPGFTTQLGGLLGRWKDGDELVVNEIISYSQERLRQMAHNMLAAKPHVKRWQQTDDVLQQALMRLHRAMLEIKPESKRAFIGLAALQIRRELIDMARSLGGPEGLGRNDKTDPGSVDPGGNPSPMYQKMDSELDPALQIEMQLDMHECVEKLSDDEREIVHLLFYQGLTQAEAAELIGVSTRTVKCRWLDARISLEELLDPPKESNSTKTPGKDCLTRRQWQDLGNRTRGEKPHHHSRRSKDSSV